MVTLYLYKISDPPNKLTKTLEHLKTIQGTIRGELDEFSPTILVEEDVSKYNYMFISETNRYYFIDGCSQIRTGMYEIKNVKEDVLTTWGSQVLNLEVIIDKTEKLNLGNEYIDDGDFITSAKSVTKVYNFSGGFNDDPEYILLTAGGVANA